MPLVTKAFADIITFTRASSGTYFDATGTLQTATTNAARFDYNPSTLAARGMLVEEQRTNSIRNNTMAGAVSGTPGTLPTNWNVNGLGTLTQQIVGTGTSNGISYIDIKFSGTTSTTQLGIRLDAANGIAATDGQTWTGSTWCAVTEGSTTNITGNGYNANIYNSGGTYIAGSLGGNVNTSSALTRTTHSGTIVSATAAFIQPQIYFTFSSGVAIDITLRIGLPQLELGAFATSVISTSSAAATRSADVASVNTLSPWYNASEGTIYTETLFGNTVATSTGVLSAYQSATPTTNRISIRVGNTIITTAGTDVANFNPSAIVNTVGKYATAYKVNDFAQSVNGGAPSTDTSGAVPVGINEIELGGVEGTSSFMLNGWLRRITYYPRRLSNTELQGITA